MQAASGSCTAPLCAWHGPRCLGRPGLGTGDGPRGVRGLTTGEALCRLNEPRPKTLAGTDAKAICQAPVAALRLPVLWTALELLVVGRRLTEPVITCPKAVNKVGAAFAAAAAQLQEGELLLAFLDDLRLVTRRSERGQSFAASRPHRAPRRLSLPFLGTCLTAWQDEQASHALCRGAGGGRRKPRQDARFPKRREIPNSCRIYSVRACSYSCSCVRPPGLTISSEEHETAVWQLFAARASEPRPTSLPVFVFAPAQAARHPSRRARVRRAVKRLSETTSRASFTLGGLGF